MENRKILHEIDLSSKIKPFDMKDSISFSTNPTLEDVEKAKDNSKILVVYSKDIDELLRFREELGYDHYNLFLYVDQTPVIFNDGNEIDNFEEFFEKCIWKDNLNHNYIK